jgi:hypothetical protein
MRRIRTRAGILTITACLGVSAPLMVRAEPAQKTSVAESSATSEERPFQGVYSAPSVNELRDEVFAWLQHRKLLETPLVEAITPLWQFEGKPGADQLFDALMRTLYLADNDTRHLVDQCRQWSYSPSLLQLQLPSPERHPDEPLLINNVRYFLARHLTLLTAYDDALSIFDTIDLKSVVDPAGCLFHRAVCEHHLLMKKQGLKTISTLLNQTQDVPTRYRKLAELMESDLQGVEEKSLGEVARQMKDVERRLSLNQTDKAVQEVEERIIATLDELIKKLEDQQNQSSSSGGGGGGSGSQGQGGGYQGAVPVPGATEKHGQAQKDHWGDLPPKAREEAKNLLDQQFPSHYRQAVEEYLKKLAERPAPMP